MKRLNLVLPLALLFFVPDSRAFADAGHEHKEGDPTKLGKVHFPISCGAESQKKFDVGLAMLHSFWYGKSDKAFADLAAAVVCSAPLLDMVRYELFGLGRTWNDEYGTAADPEELTKVARVELREKFLQADLGITGKDVLMEQAERDLAPAGGGHAQELEAEADIVERRAPREEPGVLEDEGDLLRVRARHGLAVDQDATRVREHETADHAEHGGLAAAARAQERNELARAHGEAHSLDGRNGPARRHVALAHAVDGDGRGSGHSGFVWVVKRVSVESWDPNPQGGML